ncbi:MAG: DUF4345 domain-containing protein [Acidobacteria bacterium]|nr:DUF4345 domain-containing protein [Acidobacteriota bacterium]
MTLWRVILVVVALAYGGFGFLFLFNPEEMSSILSIPLGVPSARTDFRAMYGGLEIGVGTFLLACALRREFVRLGLFAAACALIAMATSRTVGLLLDGFAFTQLLIAVVEWILGIASTWGAVVAKPDRDSLPTPLQDPTPDASVVDTTPPGIA